MGSQALVQALKETQSSSLRNTLIWFQTPLTFHTEENLPEHIIDQEIVIETSTCDHKFDYS